MSKLKITCKCVKENNIYQCHLVYFIYKKIVNFNEFIKHDSQKIKTLLKNLLDQIPNENEITFTEQELKYFSKNCNLKTTKIKSDYYYYIK